MPEDDIVVFAGSGSTFLTQSICDFLSVPVARSHCHSFSDGNTFVQVKQNVRGRDVFIVQSTIHRTNERFMELLFWVDALKRASAASVTAVIPYFSYAKGDKKDEPRVSIRARVCADALESVGCSRVVTMDLHSPQIQGFFRIPVDNLMGLNTMLNQIKEDYNDDIVVVAADTGFAEEARKFARTLKVPVAIGVKVRNDHSEKTEVIDIIGEVKNKTALIVDDFVISASTLIADAENLENKGARRVIAAATHGIFSPGAMKRLQSSNIETLYVTDSVENRPESLIDKIREVPVGSYFAKAIRRISKCQSVSSMFPGQIIK